MSTGVCDSPVDDFIRWLSVVLDDLGKCQRVPFAVRLAFDRTLLSGFIDRDALNDVMPSLVVHVEPIADDGNVP